jgi:hypothetical protein
MRKKALGLVASCATALVAAIVPASAIDNTKGSSDFTGDGVSDIAVVRPEGGNWTWLVRDTQTTGVVSNQFGLSSDLMLPADFDGDGSLDEMVWRPSPTTYSFFARFSSTGGYGGLTFGQNGDRPIIADFNGDGRADIAVVRPGVPYTWYFAYSDGSYASFQFGTNGDTPIAADIDADGKADLVVRRTEGSDSHWFVALSSCLCYQDFLFGLSSDRYVEGDFNGDSAADIAVVRPETSTAYRWYVQYSYSGAVSTFLWGDPSTDYPLAGDYNGDGADDALAWRTSAPYNWYPRDSVTGGLIPLEPFGSGAVGDLPTGFFISVLGNVNLG